MCRSRSDFALGDQHLLPRPPGRPLVLRDLGSRLHQPRLGLGELRAGPHQGPLELERIDLHQHVAWLHTAALDEIRRDGLDLAADQNAQIHAPSRCDLPVELEHGLDVGWFGEDGLHAPRQLLRGALRGRRFGCDQVSLKRPAADQHSADQSDGEEAAQ